MPVAGSTASSGSAATRSFGRARRTPRAGRPRAPGQRGAGGHAVAASTPIGSKASGSAPRRTSTRADGGEVGVRADAHEHADAGRARRRSGQRPPRRRRTRTAVVGQRQGRATDARACQPSASRSAWRSSRAGRHARARPAAAPRRERSRARLSASRAHRTSALACAGMQPEIHLGPLDLQTFGICFAFAFLASGALFAPAPARARQAGRLDLRGDLRGADRRPRRVAARLPHPELGRGLGRPARQHLLRLRPGLLRRPDGRRDRGAALGALARLARLAAARLRRRADRDRLRGGADRLPAVGRRRLRRAVRPAVGDGLPGRHGPDHRRGASHARSTRRSPWAS